MRKILEFDIEAPARFKQQLLRWAKDQESVLFLDSHSEVPGYQHRFSFSNFDCLMAVGCKQAISLNADSAFDRLQQLWRENQDWLFGHFSYDLKNETEQLSSENINALKFPELHFFQPELVFSLTGKKLEIHYLEAITSANEISELLLDIEKMEISYDNSPANNIVFNHRITKDEYLDRLNKVLAHIQRGDIYELNFCQEFFAEDAEIDPYSVYQKLKQVSPTPFSAYYRFGENYCLSASPERFLAKRGNRLVSQPIKGTCKRGATQKEDELLAKQLQNDEKERAENVMIVDLVRNDLSRTAARGSVKVDELCGIYAFPQVHQMISTVSCELNPKYHFVEAIKNAFPMGSMTGAPKIRAMELIEEYESTKRGIYSGAIGYIDPKGNFDFNVVIRSLLYNAEAKYLSYLVGGAITNKSIPEKEYEECLLKAEALRKVFRD